MKPQRGSRGRGVLVVVGRDDLGWWRADGGRFTVSDASQHAASILDGEFTSGIADGAIVEPLLVSHSALAGCAPVGLPDVRVICHRGSALLSMLRIPTIASGGRGNLHQGGIGAAVDLERGTITRAVHMGRTITHHPDTGAMLVGLTVPLWRDVVEAAAASGPATGLGYAGVDLVVDASLGAVVLEVNGHPGLEIQNVCETSLQRLLSHSGRAGSV